MATAKVVVKKGNDPMKTKRGRARLGPLTVNQLEALLAKAEGKNRAKIEHALSARRLSQHVSSKPVVTAEVAEVKEEVAG